jgi:hypothetical protein
MLLLLFILINYLLILIDARSVCIQRVEQPRFVNVLVLYIQFVYFYIPVVSVIVCLEFKVLRETKVAPHIFQLWLVEFFHIKRLL